MRRRNGQTSFCHRVLGTALLLTMATTGAGLARKGAPPQSLGNSLTATDAIAAIPLTPIDAPTLRALAETMAETTAVPGPYQVAEGIDLSIGLESGSWEDVVGGRIWRIRIDSPGALHLNFGFGAFHLPQGATLHVLSASDESAYIGPYTAADNSPNGLWTPMVPGDSAVIELFVPDGANEPVLEVTRAGLGFVDLFDLSPEKHELDACHIDVICPPSFMDDEERAVARLLINNSGLCTGTLLNDVGGTRTPFVLTADHCGISAQLAPTVVALFNFKTAACGSSTPGPMTDTVSGSTLRATRTDVDGTLLELDSDPPSSFAVFFAGWDRSNSVPSGTAGIHHPLGTSMAYCEDTNSPVTANNCLGGGGVNSHWNAIWTLGTTLGGSSGSALFDRASRKVIGHLSGGTAACNGNQPNGGFDCYGKLAVFWDGSSASERLRDWLDPTDTGTMMVDGLEGDAGACTPDVFEPDDSSAQATAITSGIPKDHSICPDSDHDWSTFTLTQEAGIILETTGGPFPEDTRMWLFDSGLSQVEFNDDINGGSNRHSRIDRVCGVDALPAGTYFVEIDEFGNNDEIPSYSLHLTATFCSCPTDVTLANQTVAGAQSLHATNTATLGPNLVVNGSEISVRAPLVQILDGTEIGGVFSAGNDSFCP